jgi:hypothetical protein
VPAPRAAGTSADFGEAEQASTTVRSAKNLTEMSDYSKVQSTCGFRRLHSQMIMACELSPMKEMP